MKNLPDHSRLLDQSSESLLAELLNGVEQGQPFNAAAMIDRQPSLKEMPSLLVDLAYEDYWRKIQSGGDIDVNKFVEQFPEIRERLLHMIEVGDLINQAPDVFLSLMNPEWPHVPSRLGPFEILKQIGEGAFSKVYLATDLSLAARPVTLKITQHAVREAHALGRLQHRNIVSPLGLYDELIPGLVVLSMPFCGHATLSDFIQACPRTREQREAFDYHGFLCDTNAEFTSFSAPAPLAPQVSFVQTVAWIGAQLADGLAYAHANGFFHCDIKPSNILLQQNGLPLILDFNLSVSPQQYSCSGGTLTYMAPEQLRSLGTTASFGGEADVYSLGATLIETILGDPPFGMLLRNSFENGQTRHPLDESDRRFAFGIPTRKLLGNDLAKLLESCVTLDPASRPSARRLADSLFRLAQSPNSPAVCKSRRFVLSAGFTGLAISMATAFWTVASEPTLSQRFLLGIDALVQKHSTRALRHFSRILARDPSRDDAEILKICALIQMEDWNVAYGELRQIRNAGENPEIHAMLGYVLCRWDRQNELAEHQYAMAYAAGIQRLDVLNNFAVCQIRGDKLHAAKEILAQAMQLAPDSASLVFNNATIEFKLSRQLQILPRASVAEAILRNDVLLKSREALIVAANIYWAASQENPIHQDQAFECLQKSISQGLTRNELNNLSEIQPNKSDPRFQQLLRSALPIRSAGQSEANFDRLIAPPIEDRHYLMQIVTSRALP